MTPTMPMAQQDGHHPVALSSSHGVRHLASAPTMMTPTIEARKPTERTTSGKKIHAGFCGRGEDRDAEDHGADVLGGRRLEQVRAAARAVADVVADQVGDHGRVARVVLRNAGLDLTDQVGADVGGLGVDTAAKLGEQRHEAGAKAEADDQEWSPGRDQRSAEGQEDAKDAQEAQRDDQEAGDRAAAQRDLDRVLEALCAAAAVRRFAWTAMYMPMKPESALQAAPTRNAIPVLMAVPMSPEITPNSKPIRIAATIANMAIVRYWRLRNAIAPSKIGPRRPASQGCPYRD